MLYYGRQQISAEDIARVGRVLAGDLITTGPVSAEFEQRFAEYVGAKYAVVVANGTAALHLAMIASGVGDGDRVVTSPNTFLASANCAAFVNAIPDFADVDPQTHNLCSASLSQGWRADTKAVIPVHYAGGPADMKSICKVAREHGAVVIEDACHAIGGQIMGSGGTPVRIGGHDWADITTFSFHPVKTMTTGEGGMLVTNNKEYADRARMLRTHGMVRDLDKTEGLEMDGYDERGSWYYEMHNLGYNYRITDFQCALGLSQLEKLDQFVSRRREIVAEYDQAFADLPHFSTPKVFDESVRDLTSWHLYTVQIDFDAIGRSRCEVMDTLKELGVMAHVLYIPVYLQPWYRKRYGYASGKCPNAELFYRRALTLPLYPSMTCEDVKTVISAVRSTFG